MDRKAIREGVEIGLGIMVLLGVLWFVLESIARLLALDLLDSIEEITPYMVIPAGIAIMVLFVIYIISRKDTRR